MSDNDSIQHVVPQVGLVSLPLYSPANKIYEIIRSKREESRLSSLRQLGALSIPMSGARLARWDYTAALLYYSQSLRLSGFNSVFRIGKIEFSSAISALQCLSLIWNIGHLPGTFSTEKGVYRYLMARNETKPADELRWPFNASPEIDLICDKASAFLLQSDYAGVCRVLAIIKLLSFCKDENDYLYRFVIDFAAPFMLDYEERYSAQWGKLKKSFSIIRHLSYLTVDLPFSGHRWAPNIPDLLEYHVKGNSFDIDHLSAKISELLSPVEKNIYDTMYHSSVSRTEASIFANKVESKLHRVADANNELQKWLSSGLTRNLKLGKLPNRAKIQRCVAIKFRSHFSNHPDSCVELEEKLKNLGFSHASVFVYKAWNSDILLEPDELIIDVLTDKAPMPIDIGKFLYWVTREFDEANSEPDDYFSMARKNEIEAGYYQILSRAVETHFPDISIKLDPWGLNRFGLFSEYDIAESRGGIWMASAEMNDPIAKHIFRDRSRSVPRDLADQYKELMGIKALKDKLKRKQKGKPRCRWLIITSSVKFLKDGRIIMEFDGGLLRVSARSGKLTWYGMETKNGSENPARSLRKRLSAIGITADVNEINTSFAYVEIPFE